MLHLASVILPVLSLVPYQDRTGVWLLSRAGLIDGLATDPFKGFFAINTSSENYLTDISPYPPPNIVILPFSGPISRVENRLTQTRGPRPALRSQNNASPRFLKMVDRKQLINLIHPLVVMSERQQENVYAPGERRTVLQKRRPRPSERLSFLNG